MALRNPSNVDRFMTEGHRNHKRKNYVVQRTSDNEVMGSIENGIAYEVEPYDPEKNPEELSAFIVDYANMIRDDVILLDKSVETRTRKRGNIKVKKYNNQVIPDPPCSCEPLNISEPLGEDIFPQEITVKKCKQDSCRHPYYNCIENLYNVTIFKKRDRSEMAVRNEIRIHDDINKVWNSYTVSLLQISVGCTCNSQRRKIND